MHDYYYSGKNVINQQMHSERWLDSKQLSWWESWSRWGKNDEKLSIEWFDELQCFFFSSYAPSDYNWAKMEVERFRSCSFYGLAPIIIAVNYCKKATEIVQSRLCLGCPYFLPFIAWTKIDIHWLNTVYLIIVLNRIRFIRHKNVVVVTFNASPVDTNLWRSSPLIHT